MLFGPAYKGIGLVNLTAAALAKNYGLDYPFAFNRKEAKDHGEGVAANQATETHTSATTHAGDCHPVQPARPPSGI